jgi:hypothetical protein
VVIQLQEELLALQLMIPQLPYPAKVKKIIWKFITHHKSSNQKIEVNIDVLYEIFCDSVIFRGSILFISTENVARVVYD